MVTVGLKQSLSEAIKTWQRGHSLLCFTLLLLLCCNFVGILVYGCNCSAIFEKLILSVTNVFLFFTGFGSPSTRSKASVVKNNDMNNTLHWRFQSAKELFSDFISRQPDYLMVLPFSSLIRCNGFLFSFFFCFSIVMRAQRSFRIAHSFLGFPWPRLSRSRLAFVGEGTQAAAFGISSISAEPIVHLAVMKPFFQSAPSADICREQLLLVKQSSLQPCLYSQFRRVPRAHLSHAQRSL